MNNQKTVYKQFNYMITGLIALMGVCSFWIFSRFTVDDAFITWRYGKNLVDFGVWNYNPADVDMTQAYTNPIYAVLSIVPNYFKIDVVFFFKILSLLYFVIFIIYMVKKTGKIKSILLFLALPATMIHAFSGLETFLFVSLLSLLFISLYEYKFKSSIILTLILFLTRPESWLLAGLIPFYFLFKRLEIDFSNLKKSLSAVISRGNLDWRNFFISSLIFVLFLGSYFIFHKWHFGYALPNTFYVKTGSSFAGFHLLLHYLYIFGFILILFFSSKYKLFLLFSCLFGAEIISYIFSDLQMNYIDRFGFHIFAPIFFILLYVNMRLPNEKISKIFNFRIRSNYLINLVTILFVISFNTYSKDELIGISVYYPRAIDTHALLGKELNKLKNNEGINSFSFGDAGMTAYHSEMIALDNIGLGSSWVAKNKGVSQEIISLYKPDIVVTYNDNLNVYGQQELLKYAKNNNYMYLCQISWQPGYYLGLYTSKKYTSLEKICQSSLEKNEISNKYYLKKIITHSPWSYWHE